jgi:hypothetical protein
MTSTGLKDISVKLTEYTKTLDTKYYAQCETCCWRRDFGYMETTCERMTDLHAERGDGHDVVVYAYPAPALDRTKIVKELRAGRRKLKVASVILSPESQPKRKVRRHGA